MLGHGFLKYKLAGDMTCGRQQLWWQKQVIVIGFIDLDSQIDEYHIVYPNFDTPSVTVAQRFAATSLFFVEADVTVGHSENCSV